MELNYQNLLEHASDRKYVTEVACYAMNDYTCFHTLSKEQILNLLNHPVWKQVFLTIFISDIKLFYSYFEKKL